MFAGSDSALKPEEKTAADARCKTGEAVDLPMVVGPIAVGYNLEGVDDLQLSPTTIAEIFAGKITTWDDAAIKADNPDATLPSTAIQTYHRNDDSGTTDNFTKYLTATAPDVWTFEGGKKWTAPGGNGVKGSDGVATAVSQTDGAIGYMELSFATNQNIADRQGEERCRRVRRAHPRGRGHHRRQRRADRQGRRPRPDDRLRDDGQGCVPAGARHVRDRLRQGPRRQGRRVREVLPRLHGQRRRARRC